MEQWCQTCTRMCRDGERKLTCKEGKENSKITAEIPYVKFGG